MIRRSRSSSLRGRLDDAMHRFCSSLGAKVIILAVALTIVAPTAPSAADSGIAIVSISEVFERLNTANNILLTAYALDPDSEIVQRLQDAASRGAHISIGLDENAFDDARTSNDAVASQLELSAIEVHKIPESHVKAVFVDGTMYLSDRNWPATSNAQVVVKDMNAGDRRIVSTAILGGRLGSNDHLWTMKAEALKAEAAVIMARTSNEVDVESETFGSGTPVFEAMMARVAGGDSVKLLIALSGFKRSAAARHAVVTLQARHVEVRLTNANEKLAIEGYNCFFGSANATRELPQQIDFGIAMRDAALATRLHSQFESEWNAAVPAPLFVPQRPPHRVKSAPQS
jgi:hypothetical protein